MATVCGAIHTPLRNISQAIIYAATNKLVLFTAIFLAAACSSGKGTANQADDHTSSDPASKQSILVPAYFDPNDADELWDRLAAAAEVLGPRLAVIVNPWDGPEWAYEATHDAYSREIARLRAAGAEVIGYVYTMYMDAAYIRDHIASSCSDDVKAAQCSRILCGMTAGASDSQLIDAASRQVECHIGMWADDYDVDGVFLDEAPTEAGKEDYYRRFFEDAREDDSDAMVVLNPGTADEHSNSYLTHEGDQLATQIVVFEQEIGLVSWSEPSWIKGEDASKIAALVQKTSADDFEAELAKSKEDNIGWIYITEKGADAWGDLSTYFERLVEAVR
jgi:hypothetical protein